MFLILIQYSVKTKCEGFVELVEELGHFFVFDYGLNFEIG